MPDHSHRDPPAAPRLGAAWLWAAIIFAVVYLLFSLAPRGPRSATVPYTTLRQQVEQGNVTAVDTTGQSMEAQLKRPLVWPPGSKLPAYTVITAVRPPFADPGLLSLLLAHHVAVTSHGSGNSWFLNLLLGAFPALLFVGWLLLMGRQVQRGPQDLFRFGQSRARIHAERDVRVTFADVAGETEAKEALQDIVEFLRNPRPFRALGARIPKGVLLAGPPGTGKTLLARAVAGEAGCVFFNASATEFVEMFVGVGAARIRDLFRQAKASSPAIIFLDEIDAVGRRRGGAAVGPGNEEREQTLNQLLGEMDGFEPREGVVVIGATNRVDVLDPALLRAGRFDRQVMVGLPDRPARAAILRIHASGIRVGPDVDLDAIARDTVGFSGADLANLVNEAAIIAARRHAEHVTMSDFENAEDRIVMGGLSGFIMSEREKRVVAYHEAGHAVAALLSPEADPVRKVSIVPRGRALGATKQVPLDDHHNYSARYLFTRLVVLLGGRAAEELVFHQVTTGAEDDLRQATQLARQMVARWGMSRLGPVGFEPRGEAAALPRITPPDYSEATSASIDQETVRLLSEAHREASHLLHSHRTSLTRLAEALLREEVIDPATMPGPRPPRAGPGARPRSGARPGRDVRSCGGRRGERTRHAGALFVLIFAFIQMWGAFIWPLLIANNPLLFTMEVGLTAFQFRFSSDYGKLMAGSVISVLPMLLVFLVFRRRIVESVALSGLKG
jgi:cell division protease FtsH